MDVNENHPISYGQITDYHLSNNKNTNLNVVLTYVIFMSILFSIANIQYYLNIGKSYISGVVLLSIVEFLILSVLT